MTPTKQQYVQQGGRAQEFHHGAAELDQRKLSDGGRGTDPNTENGGVMTDVGDAHINPLESKI